MPTLVNQRIKPDAHAATVRLGPQSRSLSLKLASGSSASPLDASARTLTMSFCSEEPVPRWFGNEVLSMKSGAFNFDRLNDGANLLFNHNYDDVLGVVEKAWGEGNKGQCVVRFAKTPRADEVMGMVADGILRNVSFAYEVRSYSADDIDPADSDDATYTATDWMAYEISIVTVPADASVGIGRAINDEEKEVRIVRAASALKSLTPEVVTPPPASADSEKTKGITMPPVIETADPAIVEQTRDSAIAAERTRVTEIEALCEKHKVSTEVRRGMVKGGATIEQARGTVLDEMLRTKQNPVASLGEGANPDLTEKEKANYSLIRAVNAAIGKDWSKAGFEREVSSAIAERSKRGESLGFYMPTNVDFAMQAPQVRAPYAVGAQATGGVLVQQQLLAGNFIELLRNKARVLQLGGTLLSGLVGNVDIPRQSGASTAYWVGEGANIPESEATFEKLGLTPRTLGCYSYMTRNMLLQATPDIEMLARADLLAVIALEIDARALYGTGAGGQPMGIANTSGIGSVIGGVNGAQFTIDNFIDLETQVTAANVGEDTLAYLANAKTIGWVKKLKASTGSYLWSNSTGAFGQRTVTPGDLNGYPVARSNQVRANLTKGTSVGVCSELFFGNWSELFVGEWGVLEILPNPYGAGYKSGSVELRAMQTIDIGLRHPASFAVQSDGLTV